MKNKFIPYKVKDISLAEWGINEIKLAESECRIGGERYNHLRNLG